MNNVQGIIFDMDGIIFDTEKLYLDTWKRVFEKYGYVMTKDIYTSVMGRGRKNVIKTFLMEYGEDLPIYEMYKEKDYELNKLISNNEVDIKKGVYELLDFLKINGYKIALATSAKRERTMKHLIHAEIAEKFDVILCGEDVVNSKPNPEIFLKAVNKLGIHKEKCIVIEDSEAGVKAAYNGGIKVINIPDLKELDEEVKRCTYKIFKDLTEVKKYLNIKVKKIS